MTSMKRRKPKKKAGSQTSVRSSADAPTVRSMNYWLEKIRFADIAMSWIKLRAIVRDARGHIMSGLTANGITSKEDYRLDVTACITADGFVLRFTVKDTSKSNGAK